MTDVAPRVVTPNGDMLNDVIYFKFDNTLSGLPLESQIYDGTRPIIGLNRYVSTNGHTEMDLVRTARNRQTFQVQRLKAWKSKRGKLAQMKLDELSDVVDTGGNVFAKLIECVEHCSLGQITHRLREVVGPFRPVV